MKRILTLLQVVAVALLIWALVLGFSVFQGKAAPSTHMNVAVVAAVISIVAHVFALVSSPGRSAP